MEKFFLNLVNYSLVAGWLILAVLLVRLIFKKAPKWIICILWALVAVRLICPFSIESIFSLVPSSKPLPDEFITTATPFVDTGITAVDQVINPIVESSLSTPDYMFDSAYRTQVLSFIAALIWIAGMVIMLLYAIISSILLKFKLRTATILEKGIKQSDRIGSPFVFGFFRPYIYLPYSITGADFRFVVEHEKAHIKRRDYLWKPIGFVILSVYWFNPLIWVAYIFLCRDIEAACDEKVVNKIGDEKRSEYSTALLNCSIKRRMIAACPIAFGETGVKSRIKNIMNYKKPAFWILIVSLVACIVVAVCFMTNPEKAPWQYSADMNSDEWKNMSMEEKYEACRIPKKELDKMSDEELVQAVNDYPFLLDLLALDSWPNIFESRCDAFARLKTKGNAIDILGKFIEENYSGEIGGEDKLKRDSLNLLLSYLKRTSRPVADADTYLVSEYNIFNNVFKSLEDYSDDKKVEEYLTSLHELSTEELVSRGVWLNYAISNEERLNIWNDFATRVNSGKPAAIVIGGWGEEFFPLLDYLSFDGNQFYYRYDNTCDLWSDVHDIHPSETYKYLVNVRISEGTVNYLLTNNQNLDYVKFRYDLLENTDKNGEDVVREYETSPFVYVGTNTEDNEVVIGKCIYDWRQSGEINMSYSHAEKIMQSYGFVADIVKNYGLDDWYNKTVSYYVNNDKVFDLDINFSQYNRLLEEVGNVKLISEKCTYYPGDFEPKLTDYVVINATEELRQEDIVLDKIAIGEEQIYIYVHEKDGNGKIFYMPYKNGTFVSMANVRGILFGKENFDEYATSMSSHKNIFEPGTYQNNTGYYVDLNGDGVKEDLLVAKANADGGYTGELIYINGECVIYQGYDDGVLADRFGIIDVVDSDGKMEILIDYDMSAYSGSRLYSYQDEKLFLLGDFGFSLMKKVGDDFYNRILDKDKIPGDGTLFGYANLGNVLQDNLYADITLKLNKEHTGFILTDELFYPGKYNEEHGIPQQYHKLRYKVCVAEEMDSSTIERNKVIENGDVIIDITDGKRWIHIYPADGKSKGGWIDMDAMLDYILDDVDPSYLLQSSFKGDVLFENLNHAG